MFIWNSEDFVCLLKSFRPFYLCVLPHLFQIPRQIPPPSLPFPHLVINIEPFWSKPLLWKQSVGCWIFSGCASIHYPPPSILCCAPGRLIPRGVLPCPLASDRAQPMWSAGRSPPCLAIVWPWPSSTCGHAPGRDLIPTGILFGFQ